ncbi:lysozyme inhibitor LprI family protein [Wenyingzhuangia sp. 1_MG-2023]|nr:lysozyme inhibitor LprI family protein [Wenyingzhuangia sp. 1_MG-2023]
MKKIILIFILVFLNNVKAFSQKNLTKNERESYEYLNFKKIDIELNKTYNEILKEYHDDKKFIENLIESQKMWLKFREIELDLLFPDYPKGTTSDTCRPWYLKVLTKRRLEHLKIWIEKETNENYCIGSIKWKK